MQRDSNGRFISSTEHTLTLNDKTFITVPSTSFMSCGGCAFKYDHNSCDAAGNKCFACRSDKKYRIWKEKPIKNNFKLSPYAISNLRHLMLTLEVLKVSIKQLRIWKNF